MSLYTQSPDGCYMHGAACLINVEEFLCKAPSGPERADAASEFIVSFNYVIEDVQACLAGKQDDKWQERGLRCMLILLEDKRVELRRML